MVLDFFKHLKDVKPAATSHTRRVVFRFLSRPFFKIIPESYDVTAFTSTYRNSAKTAQRIWLASKRQRIVASGGIARQVNTFVQRKRPRS